jgi:hypothetical protein
MHEAALSTKFQVTSFYAQKLSHLAVLTFHSPWTSSLTACDRPKKNLLPQRNPELFWINNLLNLFLRGGFKWKLYFLMA